MELALRQLGGFMRNILWAFIAFAGILVSSNLKAEDQVDWKALADRCVLAGLTNFRTTFSNETILDGFRAQLPEYSKKLLGFGPEVKSSEIKLGKLFYSYATSGVSIHPDLEEAVVAIDVTFLVEFLGPQGKTSTTLYTERIWGRNTEVTYNCHYDENFRLGAVHPLSLPFGVQSFASLLAGMKEL